MPQGSQNSSPGCSFFCSTFYESTTLRILDAFAEGYTKPCRHVAPQSSPSANPRSLVQRADETNEVPPGLTMRDEATSLE